MRQAASNVQPHEIFHILSNTGAVKYTFRKTERLCRKKIIEKLFREGASFFIYPFKVYWLETVLPGDARAQVLITAGRKSFRKAVERNRAKRLIREAYRQNKHLFFEHLKDKEGQYAVAIILTGTQPLTYLQTREKIIAVIRRLINEVNKSDAGLSNIKYPHP